MLIFGIDKFMSECRALVNFFGNAVATLFVAKWENGLDLERARAVLAGRAGEPSLTTEPDPEPEIKSESESGSGSGSESEVVLAKQRSAAVHPAEVTP